MLGGRRRWLARMLSPRTSLAVDSYPAVAGQSIAARIGQLSIRLHTRSHLPSRGDPAEGVARQYVIQVTYICVPIRVRTVIFMFLTCTLTIP
jgi:hypothetical protein